MKRRLKTSFDADTETAKKAVLQGRGESWEIMTWRDYASPKGIQVLPCRSWLVQVTYHEIGETRIETDLVMMNDNTFIVIPNIQKVRFVEYEPEKHNQAEDTPKLLAHYR